ncbi:tetratricopeptide repeat protein [Archangium sp.]|uniref:tetratricopeptide repeat protein n=1 Tax=Archangium sp. TaxID=1872627 RepID=UPI002D5BEC52|nr:tetratricopeptide repeat protein [Archangium sp.]HYO59529.1 tetratricopeptide repeat protein [Archangium sp.]
MECPSETTLSDFLAGLLPAEQRASVLAHVEGCASCQQQVALGASSTPGVPAVQPSKPPLGPGSTLSRYVLRERIGLGAMGEVYAAYDPELDRQVALKLLRPEGRQVEELRLRLLREAQALARLSHPNVVAVHDVGMCGERVFLAMELVEGTTLAEWLKEPRPWPEVLRVFVGAGWGLAAAHAAGLVHRDFKPANVLVGRDGRVRVTDFGLARPSTRVDMPRSMPVPPAPPPGGDLLTPLTRTGALLGTPAYMAPEQLDGQGVDALSDQFSFCVALYEALHRVRPFEGVSLEELGRAAREGRVRPPGREPKVPARVRRAVLRGLRARPEERFPSMEALLAALTPRPLRIRTWVATSAAAASLLGVALGYRVAHRREALCAQETEKLAAAWGPERRERVRAAFLATGKPYASSAWEAVSSALDIHASSWRSLRTGACLAAARDSSSTAWRTTACLDTRLWHLAAITAVLEKADVRTVQNAPQMVASLEGLTGCEDAPAHVTRPQPPDALRPQVDAARRRLAEARARLDAGNHTAGIEVTTALLKEIQGLDYRPLEAEVLALHGHLHGLSGKLKESEDILYRALWAADAGRDDETVARVWILLLWVVGDQMARMDEANRLVQHARAAVERLGRERFPAIATDLHLRMGGLLLVQGKLDAADAEFSRGLELSRKAHGPESLRTSYFLSGLGRVRSRQMRGAEALALYRQAQELRERLWGPEHPSLALNLNNIASELLSLGRPDEALATFRRSLSLLEAARSPDHPSLAAPLNNLAVLLRREGRLEEARQHFQRALAIFERSKGPDHPNTITALCGLGGVAYDSHHLDVALAYNQQALERIQRGMGPDTPRAELPLRNLALVHLRAGRPAQAREHLLRAQRLLEKENGPDSVVTTGVLRDLALVDLATGAPRSALAHCQRILKLDEQAQGAENPDVALDLACLAEAHLDLGAPEQAVPLLERARRIHERAPSDGLDAARASFLLARALWERRTPQERARATALAAEAWDKFESLGTRARLEQREVAAWRARHPQAVSEASR